PKWKLPQRRFPARSYFTRNPLRPVEVADSPATYTPVESAATPLARLNWPVPNWRAQTTVSADAGGAPSCRRVPSARNATNRRGARPILGFMPAHIVTSGRWLEERGNAQGA